MTQPRRFRFSYPALGFILLILFVLVIPTWMEVTRIPRAPDVPVRKVALASWPIWPDRLESLSGPAAGDDLKTLYSQMARFANQSAVAMADVERVIADRDAGRASGNALYQASQSALHAAADERDALGGLVLPSSLRDSRDVKDAWQAAQMAALAKGKALAVLVDALPGERPWEKTAYRTAIQEVRDQTTEALNDMVMAAKT